MNEAEGKAQRQHTSMEPVWHDEWHSFLWVWVSANQRIPLSVLALNPHKRVVRDIFLRDRMKTRKGKVPGHSRRRQSAKESGQRKATAKWGAKTCGHRGRVGQRERMSRRSWWLCGNFARIHARVSPQMHRKLQKSPQTSPFLILELTQVRACLFFFFSTLLVVYFVSCVFVKKCEIPLAGDERIY